MTDRVFTAACVQLRSGRDEEDNIASASALIREAAGAGADYVQTPETTNLMERDRRALFSKLQPEDESKAVATFRALAAELGIWLHIGSLALRIDDATAVNRALLITPEGGIAARYDKIHMFDVDLDGGESYRESKHYRPGREAVLADLPWGRLGLSICYDLRFSHLYRTLAKAGANILAIPAAFTKQTGEAHWHVLQRARAIEAGAFVVSAAQGGLHQDGRETFGHSLIIDPWGRILAESGDEPGVILAEIDVSASAEARRKIPALTNDRPFEVTAPAEPLRRVS